MEQQHEELDYEDDMYDPSEQRLVRHRGAASDNSRRTECDICYKKFTNPRNHALQAHLPWYVAPNSACWICGIQELKFLDKHIRNRHPTNQSDAKFDNRQQMFVELLNGLFRELARILEVSLPAGLEDKINRHMRVRTQAPPKEYLAYEKPLVDLFIQLNHLEPLQNYLIATPPHMKLHHLIHWKILKNLISELSSENQLWLMTFEERKTCEGLLVQPHDEQSEPIPVADAHCHLDQLCKRGSSAGLYKLDNLGTKQEYHTSLNYIVANYVYPGDWPSSSKRSELRGDPHIYFTFGIHPRLVLAESSNSLVHMFKKLKDMVKSTRTVGVGECGLDTTDGPTDSELQKQIVYFRKQIQLAVDNNLTIVVHSRGKPDVHHQTLDSLINICPSSQPIHWHCFTGSIDVYLSATEKFDNMVFGITPFLLKKRYPSMRKIVQCFGLEKLVLESDAPYIPLPKTSISNPYVIHPTAKEISEICGIPVENVFSKTTENCRKVYGMK